MKVITEVKMELVGTEMSITFFNINSNNLVISIEVLSKKLNMKNYMDIKPQSDKKQKQVHYLSSPKK